MKYLNRIVLVIPFFSIFLLGNIIAFVFSSASLARRIDKTLIEILDICELEADE